MKPSTLSPSTSGATQSVSKPSWITAARTGRPRGSSRYRSDASGRRSNAASSYNDGLVASRTAARKLAERPRLASVGAPLSVATRDAATRSALKRTRACSTTAERISSMSSLAPMSIAIRRSASARWSWRPTSSRRRAEWTPTLSERATADTNIACSWAAGPPSSATSRTPHGAPPPSRIAAASRLRRRPPELPSQSGPDGPVSATGPSARRARAGRPCGSPDGTSPSAPTPRAIRGISRPSRRSRTATRS